MATYHPGPEYKKSSSFGRRVHPITNKATGHGGDDWRAPNNTPIRAAYDGVVKDNRSQYNAASGTYDRAVTLGEGDQGHAWSADR